MAEHLKKPLPPAGPPGPLYLNSRCVMVHVPGQKDTVITPSNKNWEYRCNGCGQLRFVPSEKFPAACGVCGSGDILVGRPGTLPTEQNQGEGEVG